MSDAITATPTTQPTTMTEEDWRALGERLFGANMDLWRFKCPHCEHVMSMEKARAMSEESKAKLRGDRGDMIRAVEEWLEHARARS